jgi:hypothetical protein
MNLFDIGLSYPVSTVLGILSFLVSPFVLAYRWKKTPRVRPWLDSLQRRFTGQPDWRWLSLRHIMLGLLVVTGANIAWQVSTLHCSDDSLAILASGQAALQGHNPFLVSFCGGSGLAQIPYGTAEVALNALGAVGGSVLGMWLVWQLLALAVIPLVWFLSGDDRRYLTALAATSALYLPNITTNIGVENAVIPVAVLLMLYSLVFAGRKRVLYQVLAAFLATARFPALFPLLGASAPLPRGRLQQTAIVLGTFFGAVLLSYALWGSSAITVVYLGQVTRASDESLNLFAVVLTQGWVVSSYVSAAVQGAGIIILVLVVNWRRYSATAACAIPLIGVMALSQYLTFHFVLWLVPLVLLGGLVNRWLYVYAVVAWFDENIPLGYYGLQQGIWWPYEVCGIVLLGILVYLLIVIVRNEEARLRGRVRPEAEDAVTVLPAPPQVSHPGPSPASATRSSV